MRIENKLNLLFLFIFFSFILACQTNPQRKIKIASSGSHQNGSNATTSSVLRVAPEEQRTIAISYFENDTGDEALDWLERGLGDMLISELSQSPYLNIVSGKSIDFQEKQDSDNAQRAILDNAAKQAMAEVVISGRYFRDEDSLCIEVQLSDALTREPIHLETIRGSGLERIFAMVDVLSNNVRNNLRGEANDSSQSSRNIAELTKSVEAFRHYSCGLDRIEKFHYAEAEQCLEKAVQIDPLFAAGYVQLATVYRTLAKVKKAEWAFQKAQSLSERLSEVETIRLKLLDMKNTSDRRDIIPMLEDAVRRMPAELDLREQLARFYREYNKPNKALEEFETILDYDPSRKNVYNDIGYLFAYRGDYTSALKYIDKYQQYAPNEANPYDSKGEILMMAGRLEEAARQLKTALEKWPAFYHSAERLAIIYRELADYDQAMYYAHQAAEHAPSEELKHWLTIQQALIHWRFGNIKQAYKIFSKSIDEGSNIVTPVLYASEMFRNNGDTLTALRLEKSAYKRLEQEIFTNLSESKKQYQDFRMFALESPFAPGKTIPMLEKLLAGETNPEQALSYQFVTGLLNMRTGNLKQADKYVNNNIDEFIDLIAKSRSYHWASMWKYIFEMNDYEPADFPDERKFANLLYRFANEQNRDDVWFISQYARANGFYKQNKTEHLTETYKALGAPLQDKWQVIGPFSSNSVSGFDYAFPPEKELSLATSYSNGNRKLHWTSAEDGSYDGYTDLRKILHDSPWSVAYGVLYVHSPVEQNVQIRLFTDDSGKLWLNDEPIWQYFGSKASTYDRNIIPVALNPGDNKILIKVVNRTFDWGFQFRITDENGRGLNNLTFKSAHEVRNRLARY